MEERRMEEAEKTALLQELKRLLDSAGYLDIAKKKVIGLYGLGGAGGNILESVQRMGVKDMKNVETIAINSDERVLDHLRDVDKRVLIGKSVTEHPKGTAGNGALARKMIRAARESLEVMVSQHQVIILLGSLGGGTGSELMIELSRIGTEMGKVVIAMPVLPFSAESGRRAMAKRNLKRLEATGAMVVPLDNDSLLKDERLRKLSVGEAFEALNRIIFRKIREIQDDTLENIIEAIVEDMYRKIRTSEVYASGLMENSQPEINPPEIARPMPGLVTATAAPKNPEKPAEPTTPETHEINPKTI